MARRVGCADDATMHSYVTEPPTLGLAGRSRPQWAAAWATRLGLDTAYLLLGLPAGVIAFSVVISGWATALGLAITLIGLPIAMATIIVSRGMAERRALARGARPRRAGACPLPADHDGPDPRAPEGAVRRQPDLEGPGLAPAPAPGRHRRLHRRGLLLGVDGRLPDRAALVLAAGRPGPDRRDRRRHLVVGGGVLRRRRRHAADLGLPAARHRRRARARSRGCCSAPTPRSSPSASRC